MVSCGLGCEVDWSVTMRTRAPDKEKTLDELAREQRLQGAPTLERLIGRGRRLWGSNREFREFLDGIYQRRAEDRRL